MDQLSVKGDQVAVNGEQPALIFEIGELRELPEGCLFGFTGCTGEEALAEYRRLYGREAVAVYTRRGRFELGGRPWVQSWVRPDGETEGRWRAKPPSPGPFPRRKSSDRGRGEEGVSHG